MTVSLIAAVGENMELGKAGDLIWHFKEDMKFFKSVTTGHSVIMGRKTFESLPHALPNRKNIVITSNKAYIAEGAEVVAGIDEALRAAGDGEIFIIGGGKIYGEFIKYADKIYLTEIKAKDEKADTFFPNFDREKYEKQVLKEYEDGEIRFSHVLYSRL